MNTSQIRPKNVILPTSNMMYPFMTLDDNAEIVHSEMGKDGRVKVYIEKPDAKDGFHRATCYLPSYTWEDIFGFSDEEIDRYKKVIESTAHLIIEFSQKGGFSNASPHFKCRFPVISETSILTTAVRARAMAL